MCLYAGHSYCRYCLGCWEIRSKEASGLTVNSAPCAVAQDENRTFRLMNRLCRSRQNPEGSWKSLPKPEGGGEQICHSGSAPSFGDKRGVTQDEPSVNANRIV